MAGGQSFCRHAGFLIAMAAFGIRLIAICAESDDLAAAHITSAFPDAIHVSDAKEIKATMLTKMLEKRKLSGILVCGSPPCHPKIPNDSEAVFHFCISRLAADIRELPQAKGVRVLEFMETPFGSAEVRSLHS